ncbi:palmitoyltransferase ZDHHC6 [Anopheles arabiensis]|uniref:Palmitoyltransferase n=1 Tax=Anopheles arabiensis TaxID=7173 RepID=A0A182HMT6_ANOAR|nr:palmitoyltransferase ZDHHC6 [Anopheles arabiensis]
MFLGCYNAIRRFLHWGPLTAIGIIQSITVMTIYMNSMWWPSHTSLWALINQTVFVLLSLGTGFYFVMASLTGPGYLRLKWRPAHHSADEQLQFCIVCGGYKAPRSHHCRKCDRCVIKMDHHCPWINNCVGWANHGYFTAFLAFAVLGCIHGTVILGSSLYVGLYRDWYVYYGHLSKVNVKLTVSSLVLCVFNIGLAIGVVLTVGALLVYQVRSILNNRTAIEDWIVEKARFRAERNEQTFVYPYDLGRWSNVKQVINFTCRPVGNGYEWPVVEGCDQYTLTREQLAQKEEKRARTRTYTIVRPATGSWFPLFSQGPSVCLSPPLTDEPRIKLEVDDIVRVTRWRKHWLFGEKLQEPTKKTIPKRIRGWFPRKCAVEYIELDDDDAVMSGVPPIYENTNKKDV